ncbi:MULTISPECIES: BrnA antitoxin family protein [Rhizobium/Agrobacterium group]|uniref:BrnA antitoxin family protein n=2 Tax=Agrobacterium TaxID=357 RepID=A0A0D0JZ88_AGRTU|nr:MULTISPECIES: BrnA antitoxin family protein [Rhizobium/Agrobacterium group]KIQ01081.1 hypothetical protein RU07_15935 [Agrobacterium tumefaciens]MBN7809283.1 BrnA antitoxin family protein [Agrobacterium rosae]MCI9868839.1 BrnA antitoxin family protein [Rhizobium skierniewicense]POO48393.1 hypothetical protein CPJ18_26405 [Agrobacterium rosae]POO48783.1 hypothetical protein CTT39_24320 [Agrobacterium rosae]
MTVKFASKRPLSNEEEAEVQRMIAADPDAPEATDEEIAQAKPFREAFPELAKSINREMSRRGRPPADSTKTPVTIRLDPDLVKHYKETGRGWQSRLNDDLRKVNGL